MERRDFLTILGLTAATAAVEAQHKTTDGGLAVIEDKKPLPRKHPILPPGAQSARHFQTHCTGCQLCVTACPQRILRPSTSLSNLLQPSLHYEEGYCLPGCHRCQDVCPTGAITAAPKAATKIGTAVYLADNCIMQTDGVSCGNCVRHCPADALSLVEGKIAVDAERCIGCGHCEYVCPARPFSAIYVEGITTQRTI